MTVTAWKRKWWLIVLITVGTFCLIVLMIISAMRASHEKEANEEAQRWLKQARQDAKPSWTEDDALAWFEQNGFACIGKEQGLHIVIGKSKERFPVVNGYRPIEAGGVIAKRYWVRLAFFFDKEHKFRSVEATAWPFEPPR